MKIADWTLRMMVAAAFLISAVMKLADFMGASQRFAEWGYPPWFLYVVVAIELLGAIGLLVPKTAQTSAGVLILLMLGAIYTHYSNSDNLAAALPAIVLLLLLGFIAVLQRQERGAISL